MKDAIGNVIRDGDLMVVSSELLRNLVFQVIKVQDGGLATPQGETPGVLILGITFPVPRPSENLLDFKCLRNPESERLVDNLSGMPPRTM